jgi:nucleotide-binding universal stress UspA family protein
LHEPVIKESVVKLLLAIDPTDSSDIVVSQVAARPWPDNTVARVLTVIDDAAIPSDVLREANEDLHRARHLLRVRAEDVIEQAISELTASGLQTQTEIREGDPRFEIVDAAIEWLADFIFVRSYVVRDVIQWLMGSVSKEVLWEAPCSVDVVRATREDTARYRQSGIKILLATDGSDYSKAAASCVAGRPWPQNSEARVVSCADPFEGMVEEEVSSIEELMSRREVGMTQEENAVYQAMQVVSSAGLKTTGEVLSGYPKGKIVEEAKKWGADLVVVGSHGRRGIERILLGSVSEAVALHAHCSVEVIRSSVLLEEL